MPDAVWPFDHAEAHVEHIPLGFSADCAAVPPSAPAPFSRLALWAAKNSYPLK